MAHDMTRHTGQGWPVRMPGDWSAPDPRQVLVVERDGHLLLLQHTGDEPLRAHLWLPCEEAEAEWARGRYFERRLMTLDPPTLESFVVYVEV